VEALLAANAAVNVQTKVATTKLLCVLYSVLPSGVVFMTCVARLYRAYVGSKQWPRRYCAGAGQGWRWPQCAEPGNTWKSLWYSPDCRSGCLFAVSVMHLERRDGTDARDHC
jgi:hypothetical protein